MAGDARSGSSWHIEALTGPAQELHLGSADLVGTGSSARHEPVEGGARRRVRILSVDRPALVLGSGQPESDVDAGAAAAAGVVVVRRRSGGGAVLVEPDAVVWVDLVVPAGDPLWHADVSRATWWVGATWASALETAVGATADVWQGPMQRGLWSARVCFAGLGPGEVRIAGQKVVGVSQRRTRAGALFQTAALLKWDPAALLALLRLEDSERIQGDRDLTAVAAGLGSENAPRLVEALLAALP